MGQRSFARRQMQIVQITLVPNLVFYAPIAMEGAALFALFSTVFLVCRGRGQAYCPPTNFLPSIPATPVDKQCNYSRDCSKIDCFVRQDRHILRVILKLNTCKVPWNATVTLKQPEDNSDWSATLKDGEKAKLNVTAPSMLTGGMPVSNAPFFAHVGLKKRWGQLLDYTVELLGNLNVTLLSGESPWWRTICDAAVPNITDPFEAVHKKEVYIDPLEHPNITKSCQPDKKKPNLKEGTCPPVCLDDGTLCPVTNHCSTITCTAPPQDKGPGMKMTIQLNGCRDVQTATVTMQSFKPVATWSHTFKNGDRAVAPMPSGVGFKVQPYLKVELVKAKASIMFKLVLEIEERGSSRITMNTTILSAKLPLPKCGGSTSLKVVIIVIPVLIVLLVGLGVAFYCYRKRASGLRFPVHLTPAGSKVPMRRLSNEI